MGTSFGSGARLCGRSDSAPWRRLSVTTGFHFFDPHVGKRIAATPLASRHPSSRDANWDRDVMSSLGKMR